MGPRWVSSASKVSWTGQGWASGWADRRRRMRGRLGGNEPVIAVDFGVTSQTPKLQRI